jgi:hypothetical protein
MGKEQGLSATAGNRPVEVRESDELRLVPSRSGAGAARLTWWGGTAGLVDVTSPQAPECPKCGTPMRLRSARKGPRTGSKFWGCTNYPECDGLRDVAAG